MTNRTIPNEMARVVAIMWEALDFVIIKRVMRNFKQIVQS